MRKNYMIKGVYQFVATLKLLDKRRAEKKADVIY